MTNSGVFGVDGGPGAAASSWSLLQRPVEHFRLHCGQWGAGGFCIFVSSKVLLFCHKIRCLRFVNC